MRPDSTLLILGLLLPSAAGVADEPKPLPHRVFASSRFDIDDILKRPYSPDVPMGCVGDRLWASSPQGWAFRDDVHWLYLTNLRAFDMEIRDEHGLLQPAKATYYPSHVHMEGAVRAISASASFTYTTDNVNNPLTKPFRPEKRWTCWASGEREDWYAVDFGTRRSIDGLTIFFFEDAPNGGCRPPESFEVQRWDEGQGKWIEIDTKSRRPARPGKGENVVGFESIEASRLRLVFNNAGDNFYTGLYGVEPRPDTKKAEAPMTELKIAADKFITDDDVLVNVVRIDNPTERPIRIKIAPILPWTSSYRALGTISEEAPGRSRTEYRSFWAEGQRRLHDFDVQLAFRYAVTDSLTTEFAPLISSAGGAPGFTGFEVTDEHAYRIEPGSTLTVKAALEIRRVGEVSSLDRVVKPAGGERLTPDGGITLSTPPEKFPQDTRDVLAAQAKSYQSWFDSNFAYFDCSDPLVRKMYYHRIYNLRKNMFEPKLGAMKHPTQAEGRWRSTWYPNAISYGGGHQVREARWLRDPRYWQGHLRTWAENPKPDGVYPSHVKPAGPQQGQYTDWISSTAWEGHLVHPNKQFLTSVADKLAANTRAWQKVYDTDDDGLLLVDSHWWTGMEYQPSFFYFSDYKPSKDFNEPANKVSLERVDLTSYNYGNAVNVAKVYRAIGQPEKAKEFDALAEKIAKAVLDKMWKDEGQFFYSLKADDDRAADVKEIIGVYPFYFGLAPPWKGYETAWTSVLDPEQFWTPWPVASVSKKCPVYSQTNWPGDGRRTACMWNGPTWPHANSIVLTAMARTLRANRVATEAAGGLSREKLWELFHSFTRAQFHDQDIDQPWTGEYYDGETGKWKTAERDYNHSTWLDILIPDLIGLVPRDDDVIEVDPWMPMHGALEHFLLDGQHYRGHDVTIVWDALGGKDHYGDGRQGLDVYVDGKLAASRDELGQLEVKPPAGAGR